MLMTGAPADLSTPKLLGRSRNLALPFAYGLACEMQATSDKPYALEAERMQGSHAREGTTLYSLHLIHV